jgi:hypothetical protein
VNRVARFRSIVPRLVYSYTPHSVVLVSRERSRRLLSELDSGSWLD